MLVNLLRYGDGRNRVMSLSHTARWINQYEVCYAVFCTPHAV